MLKERTFRYEYEIGDAVFLSLPESPVGRVIDVSYQMRHKEVLYLVMFEPAAIDWFSSIQLSRTRSIV